MATAQFLTTTARRCTALGTSTAGRGGMFAGSRLISGQQQQQQQQIRQLSCLSSSLSPSSSSRVLFSARSAKSTPSVFSKGGVVRYESTAAEGETKIWSFEQLKDLTSKSYTSPIVIDVREPHELQNTGRIPGAINVPIKSAPESFLLPEEDFEAHYGFARPAKDAEVVFYCKAGVRSRAAAGIAKGAGWVKVGEYPGSWDEWFGKGGEVER